MQKDECCQHICQHLAEVHTMGKLNVSLFHPSWWMRAKKEKLLRLFFRIIKFADLIQLVNGSIYIVQFGSIRLF
jgi:hypothetical protein